MIGERIVMLRKEQNLSRNQMAEMLGVSVTSWRKYEVNEAEPSITNITKIANFFKVSLDFLLGVTNIRSNEDYKQNTDESNALKDLENLNVGDTSNINSFIANFSTTIDYYEKEDMTEIELQMLLKLLKDITVYMNSILEARKDTRKYNIERVLSIHENEKIRIIKSMNEILTNVYIKSLQN